MSAAVNSGRLEMYIGLNQGQTQKYLWKADAKQGETAKISVKTSDSNFHIGALYYVILRSAEGRVDVKV